MVMTPELKHKIFKERAKSGEVIDWLSGSSHCFSCHKNIYEYLTVTQVETETITGCPVCHRSFVD